MPPTGRRPHCCSERARTAGRPRGTRSRAAQHCRGVRTPRRPRAALRGARHRSSWAGAEHPRRARDLPASPGPGLTRYGHRPDGLQQGAAGSCRARQPTRGLPRQGDDEGRGRGCRRRPGLRAGPRCRWTSGPAGCCSPSSSLPFTRPTCKRLPRPARRIRPRPRRKHEMHPARLYGHHRRRLLRCLRQSGAGRGLRCPLGRSPAATAAAATAGVGGSTVHPARLHRHDRRRLLRRLRHARRRPGARAGG